MKRILFALLGILIVFSCNKPETTPPGPDPDTPHGTDPVTPIVNDVISITSGASVSLPAGGGTATVTFTASGAWTVKPSGTWLAVTPSKGSGDGSVTLSAGANPDETDRSAEVVFTCGSASAKVTVTQQRKEPEETPYQAVTVYYEDMDHTPSYSGWMSDASWHNATGEGASAVTYDCFNASIRNDNYGSKGNNGTYSGASGKCYGRLTQASSGNFGYLTVSHISTCGYSNFSLSFGAAQGGDVLKVEVSPDGTEWTQLQYSFGQNYNRWGLAQASFSVGSAVTELYIKFTLTGSKSSYAYGANIDDLCLETAEDASDVVIGRDGGSGKNWAFAELPARQDNPDYYYNTLYTNTVRTNKYVRNYSFCYDTRRHNPIWVAFPMHSIYAEGSGRTTPDPWMQYPDMSVNQQSVIWDITGDGQHQYWTYTSAIMQVRYYWGRGHLCMSSSRPGAGKEINLQTFYPVNVAPQAASPSVFPTIWGKTESLHYQNGTQVCADTLYVVAGCYYDNDNNIEYDACYGTDRCSFSKACIVPTHQYKLFLRTRSGNTGKPVQECEASELKAIGFWFDSVPDDGASTNLADYAMSVADIEDITGITFFPDIPASVKRQCAPGDWGL